MKYKKLLLVEDGSVDVEKNHRGFERRAYLHNSISFGRKNA